MAIKTISLYDYEGKKTDYKIDMSYVEAILIKELSGDKVAYVKKEDGTVELLDSSHNRTVDYDDGEPPLLIFRKGVLDLVDKFINDEDFTDEEWDLACDYDEEEFVNVTVHSIPSRA